MSASRARPRTVANLLRIGLGLTFSVSALASAHPAKAQAETVCQWGGTLTEPTGTLSITPGVTNFPAPTALKFVPTGALTGSDQRCYGQQMKWIGQLDAGSSCLFASFEGTIKGLAGVTSFWGRGNILVPSYLYDKDGNLVGVENANIITQDNVSRYNNCNAPDGFNYANFNSTVVLF
jgi:hypothetical protein